MVDQKQEAQLLTVDEVAALMACSSRSVYRLSDAGKIPQPFRIGGMVRWSASVINDWIASGCPDCKGVDLRAIGQREVSTKRPSRPAARRV